MLSAWQRVYRQTNRPVPSRPSRICSDPSYIDLIAGDAYYDAQTRDPMTGRTIAHPLEDDPPSPSRREAQAASALNHPVKRVAGRGPHRPLR